MRAESRCATSRTQNRSTSTRTTLRNAILDAEVPLDIRDECVEELKQLAEDGEHYVQYFLGKLYRDGGLLTPDDEQAAEWFRRSAESGHSSAAYTLGKLLQEQGRMEEAVAWYSHASKQRNEFAQYRLAKLYLTGDGVPKDVSRAVELLEASVGQGNQHAEYLLGKLYLDGTLAPRDIVLGMAYMEHAAQQGNAYAQLFVDRRDSLRPPSVMLSVTRLFQRMGQIFQDHSLPQSGAVQFGIDRKRMQEMQYTIYNALGKEPSAWRDGKPLATVQLTTPAEYEAYTAKFWPWHESELTNYESFRDGFILGARLIMEIACGQSRFNDDG